MHNHICGEDCQCETGLDLNEVTLEDITETSLMTVLKLNVAEKQKKYVAPNAVSISQAHYSKTAWFKAICYEKMPVGFVMVDDDASKPEYFLWRFMVDERYQENGIGQKALELVVEYIKTRPGAKVLLTSCVPGEDSPSGFYEKFGFNSTGEVVDDEIVYALKL